MEGVLEKGIKCHFSIFLEIICEYDYNILNKSKKNKRKVKWLVKL